MDHSINIRGASSRIVGQADGGEFPRRDFGDPLNRANRSAFKDITVIRITDKSKRLPLRLYGAGEARETEEALRQRRTCLSAKT
jgi:hypothetical protein